MNKREFQSYLINAAKKGTLMTRKHDPSNHEVYRNYRTVLAHNLVENLDKFINQGKFEVMEYENKSTKYSSSYFEIIPTDTSFSVPTSGVNAYSPQPTEACDRIIAVSGSNQGWHLFGENSKEIENKISTGKLKQKGKLS